MDVWRGSKHGIGKNYEGCFSLFLRQTKSFSSPGKLRGHGFHVRPGFANGKAYKQTLSRGLTLQNHPMSCCPGLPCLRALPPSALRVNMTAAPGGFRSGDGYNAGVGSPKIMNERAAAWSLFSEASDVLTSPIEWSLELRAAGLSPKYYISNHCIAQPLWLHAHSTVQCLIAHYRLLRTKPTGPSDIVRDPTATSQHTKYSAAHPPPPPPTELRMQLTRPNSHPDPSHRRS